MATSPAVTDTSCTACFGPGVKTRSGAPPGSSRRRAMTDPEDRPFQSALRMKIIRPWAEPW